MKICGLNKTTLLDYPGKIAATVFWEAVISAVLFVITVHSCFMRQQSLKSARKKF